MRASFLIPGNIQRKTGGYGYDRRVIVEALAQGVTLAPVELPESFPFPTAADRADSLHILNALPVGVPVLIDGLAYGAFDQTMIAALRGCVVALVHHPLSRESGLAPRDVEALHRSEKAALARADAVIVTSAATRDLLVAAYDAGSDRITVAIPGTDEVPLAQGSDESAVVILGVGSLTPRKAWTVLLDALAPLAAHAWRLVIAGDGTERAALQARAHSHGLGARVTFRCEVDDTTLAHLYDRADLFVLPSLYEGFGMVLTEAIARGLPAIATEGVAAVRHLEHGSVCVVPQGNAARLSEAIRALLEPSARRGLAARAAAAARDLPRWSETARVIIDTIGRQHGIQSDLAQLTRTSRSSRP